MGLAVLLGGGEGTRPGRGRGGHRRPSIDSRRLEFIRHKPGKQLSHLRQDQLSPGGLCQRARVEAGQGWLALVVPGSPGLGALEVQSCRGLQRDPCLPPKPTADFCFPAKENAC